MNYAKDIAKRGWHPEKDGKGLTNLLRRDNDSSPSSTSAASDRSVQPISSLPDPSSYGPPPKSVNHPNYDPSVDGPAATAGAGKKPGPPLPKRDAGPGSLGKNASAEDEKPAGPFRVNTTGLATEGLPPPPTRIIQRSDTASVTTSPPNTSTAKPSPPAVPPRDSPTSPPAVTKPSNPAVPPRASPASPPTTKTKPALPPRLPPRESPTPPLLNQGATDRLAAAGVNVPGLGIGASTPPQAATSTKPSLSGHVPGRGANVSELEAKFAKIRATEREQEGSGATAPTPTQGEPPPVPLATKPR